MRRFGVFAVVIVMLCGCDRISAIRNPGPQDTLRAFLGASTKGNLEVAYGYVSASDRAARSLLDYQSQSADGAGLAKAFAGMVTQKIVEVTEHGATATAQVDVTTPDFSKLMGDLIGPAIVAAFGGDVDADKLGQDLASKYKNADLPKVTNRKEFKLVRDPDGWRVFMDWERKDRTKALVVEANGLREAKDLVAAEAKYREALELDGEMVEARLGLDHVREDLQKREVEAAILHEKQNYIGNVKLKNFKIADGERFGMPVKGVFGTIVNQGDRTLDKVKVTVYFLDKAGNVVGEKDYHPVYVSGYSLGGNKPLKPNYVKDFGYSVDDDAPSAWAERAKAKITDIAFAE